MDYNVSKQDALDHYPHCDIHGLYRMSSDLRFYFDEIIEGERTWNLDQINDYHQFALALTEALLERLKAYKPSKFNKEDRLGELLKELSSFVERRRVESETAWKKMDQTTDEYARRDRYEDAIDAQLEYNKAKSMQAWVSTTLA